MATFEGAHTIAEGRPSAGSGPEPDMAIHAGPGSIRAPAATNAFIRRGATVCKTAGSGFCLRSSNVPMRPGWGPAPPFVFATEYEEES